MKGENEAVTVPIKLPTPLRTLFGIKPVRPLGFLQPVVIDSIKMSGKYYPYNNVAYVFPDTTLNFTTTYLNATYGPVAFQHETSVDGVEKSEYAYLLRKGDTYKIQLSKKFKKPSTITASGKASIGPYESDSYARKFKLGTLAYEPNPVANFPVYGFNRIYREEYSKHIEKLKNRHPPRRLDFELGAEINGGCITSKNNTYYLPKPAGYIKPYVTLKNVSDVDLHRILCTFMMILVHEDERYVNYGPTKFCPGLEIIHPGDKHRLSFTHSCNWNKEYGHVYLSVSSRYGHDYIGPSGHECDYSDIKLGRGHPP